MGASNRRRHAALAALAISVIAIIATTPGPPTARAEAEGDIGVGPNEAARVIVRYAVPHDRAGEITSIEITQVVARGRSDPRFRVTTYGIVADRQYGTSYGDVSVPPADCRDGCSIDAVIEVEWARSDEAALRMGWTSELAVVYESNVPSEEPGVEVVAEGAPPIPRAGWLAIGAGAAALATLGLSALGPRLRRVRLVVAGLALVPALWLLWGTAEILLSPLFLSPFGVDLETLGYGGGALVLGAVLVLGLWRAAHGRVTLLRVAGWIELVVVGFTTWVTVSGLPTYRPHELAFLGLGLGAPIGAAITAHPLRDRGSSGGPSVPTATALVITAQLLMLGLVVVVDGYLIIVGATSFVRGHLRLELASVAIGALAIAILWGYISGLIEWRAGSRLLLGISSAPVALLVGAAGALAIAQGEGGLLSFRWEAKVAAALAILVALVGAVGVWLVPPPLTASSVIDAAGADDERRDERPESNEVPGVTDEGDGDDARDRV